MIKEFGSSSPVAGEASPGGFDGLFAPAVQHDARAFDRLAVLSHSLRAVLQAIERTVKATSGMHDLSLAHWQIMIHLGHRPTSMQRDLRRQTGFDSGFMTRLLDDLDARKLVQRRRGGSDADRRQIHLGLTRNGRDAVHAMLTTAGVSRALQQFCSSDAGRLKSLADALAHECEAQLNAAHSFRPHSGDLS